MDKKILLIVDAGGFSLVTIDQLGQRGTVYSSIDLQETLRMGAQVLGHPLVIPMSGPGTDNYESNINPVGHALLFGKAR